MSKFLKVGGWRLNMEMVLFVTPERDGEIQVVFSDEQYVRLQDEPMHALLRWLDANSETLPGDGAADEQDEQPAIRRHFLALVGYCDDEADIATERAVQAVYKATRKALVHDGELPTTVPTHEMIERLEYVISECNQALNNMSLKPHVRKVYAVLMAMADGDELPEDAS